jgi:hypothetical protein
VHGIADKGGIQQEACDPSSGGVAYAKAGDYQRGRAVGDTDQEGYQYAEGNLPVSGEVVPEKIYGNRGDDDEADNDLLSFQGVDGPKARQQPFHQRFQEDEHHRHFTEPFPVVP